MGACEDSGGYLWRGICIPLPSLPGRETRPPGPRSPGACAAEGGSWDPQLGYCVPGGPLPPVSPGTPPPDVPYYPPGRPQPEAPYGPVPEDPEKPRCRVNEIMRIDSYGQWYCDPICPSSKVVRQDVDTLAYYCADPSEPDPWGDVSMVAPNGGPVQAPPTAEGGWWSRQSTTTKLALGAGFLAVVVTTVFFAVR